MSHLRCHNCGAALQSALHTSLGEMHFKAPNRPGFVTDESLDNGATWRRVAPGDPLSSGALYRTMAEPEDADRIREEQRIRDMYEGGL